MWHCDDWHKFVAARGDEWHCIPPAKMLGMHPPFPPSPSPLTPLVSASHGLRKFDTLAHTSSPLVSSVFFRCSLIHAKRSFYRSFNAIFGKIGRLASEEVILELVGSKCLPRLLYGLECYPLIKSDLSSLDFVITRVLLYYRVKYRY